MSLKLGLKPVIARTTDLMFAKYFIPSAPLPAPPSRFGHYAKVNGKWLMLGNDRYGDCVWAGAAHEHLLWNAIWGRDVEFNDECVLECYSEATGFNAKKPTTDQGTDVHEAMSYRQQKGILDAKGNRHTIGAYVWLEPGNYPQYLKANYIFDTVGVCIDCPASAQDQFNRGRTWTPVQGSPIEGGHYIPGAGKAMYPVVITWAKEQLMSQRFYEKFNTASVVVISDEMLDNPKTGKNAQAFDWVTLQRDLGLIESQRSAKKTKGKKK